MTRASFLVSSPALRLPMALAAAAAISSASVLRAGEPDPRQEQAPVAASAPATGGPELRPRLERALDKWCRWLAGYVQPVPGTDLYTLAPKPGVGSHPYRDVAGNQFAAAAAGYWLTHARPDPQIARPLRGLIKLALASHGSVQASDRSGVPAAPAAESQSAYAVHMKANRWGAGHSASDNWHADLFAATHGMLTPGCLASDELARLRGILAWEADKQAEYGIRAQSRSLPARWPGHSVGESNAWSTALLQAARTVSPDAARDDLWRKTAIEYSLNSICLPKDLTCDELIAGTPVRQWVKGANFEPGGIQEHHGFYHPGYVAWPLAYQMFAALMDESLPAARRNSDVYLRHWKYVFNRMKQATFANGRFIHCAGDDWNAYGYGNDHLLPVAIFAAVRFRDADASRLADQWLRLMERAQEITGGPVQGARLGRLQRHYVNDFAWYEAISGATLAHALWVLDRLGTASLPPASDPQQYDADNTGTYYEPNAMLVWHRDRRRWASFSWRAAYRQWQAIVQPVALPHLLKFNHNSVGIIEAAGTTAGNKVGWTSIATPPEGGFWTLGTLDRLPGKAAGGEFAVRQYQALVVLPEGPVLWVDQCQALRRLELLRSGSLGMRLAADIFNDSQVRLEIQGAERVFGQHPDRDTWHDLQARSLTIERQLAVHALAGKGTFQLLQKRRRDPQDRDAPYPSDRYAVEESLLSHELYLGPPGCRHQTIVEPQEYFRNVVLLFSCDPGKESSVGTATVKGSPPCQVIELSSPRRSIGVNFDAVEHFVETAAGQIVVPGKSISVKSGG